MGLHGGNFYTYYGELLLPFLLFLTIPKLDELLKLDLIRYCYQGVILIFCIFPFKNKFIYADFISYQHAFSILYEYADQCQNIYDATPLIAVYKIENNMFPVFNNGQNIYTRSVIPDKNTALGKLSKFSVEELDWQLLEWYDRIENDIQKQRFDCIFAEPGQSFANYERKAEIDGILERTVNIWVPQNH